MPTPPPELPEADRPGTLLETDEDIRAALLAGAPPQTPGPLIAPVVVPPPSSRPAVPFGPSTRAPLAILTVCDDGQNEGETIRLRSERFVVGRSVGNLKLPFDGLISGKHFEITRQRHAGKWRWIVTDLQSTNGLFVRITRSLLGTRAEFLVGKGRYRFETPQDSDPETIDRLPDPAQTKGWEGGSLSQPTLTEMVGGDIANRWLLNRHEYWIGSDPACAICRTGDPFVEGRHARLRRDESGRWLVEQERSLNGLWLRIPQFLVGSTCQFQAGEQRFRLRIGV